MTLVEPRPAMAALPQTGTSLSLVGMTRAELADALRGIDVPERELRMRELRTAHVTRAGEARDDVRVSSRRRGWTRDVRGGRASA